MSIDNKNLFDIRAYFCFAIMMNMGYTITEYY